MIKFSLPWVLILIILPLIFTFIFPRIKQSQQSALKVPFFNFLNRTFPDSNKAKYQPKTFAKLIAWIAWSLLVIAAAGPKWLGGIINIPTEGRSIMMAIDLSGSMREQDMMINGKAYSRFAVVKAAASQFILDRKQDRIGLILFGTKAYLRSPLTADNKSVVQLLNNAAPGLAGEQTAIGDAIGLAIKRLSHSDAKNRILILMTDGRNTTGSVDPIKAAQMAKQLNIKIYTIGLGSTEQAYMGYFASSGPDNEMLEKIANITGGKFFYAGNAEQLQDTYKSLDKIEASKNIPTIYRDITELYPYPLALALLLSVLLALPFILNKNIRR